MGDLKTFYDDLKSEKNRLDRGNAPVVHTNPINTRLGALEWRKKATDVAQDLSNDCAKHIICDIYCKILPFDDDYKCGHQGMIKQDVDDMLASKGMTGTQYLQSCANATGAPTCEYVLNMTNLIGKQFLEEANDDLKEANDKNIDIPSPTKPDVETDQQIQTQLIDIQEDPNYSTFIDKLKKKTVDKIVSDVSKLITDKKHDKDMAFDPKTSEDAAMESVTAIALNSIQQVFMKESVNSDPVFEDILGLAIRESTLNMMNECFKQSQTDMKSFKSRMRFGNGVVITESAISALMEEAKKSPEEVDKVVNDADKRKNDEIDSKLKASDVVNAGDEKEKESK